MPGVKTYIEHIFIVNVKMIARTGNVTQWLPRMNPWVQSSALGKVRVTERERDLKTIDVLEGISLTHFQALHAVTKM